MTTNTYLIIGGVAMVFIAYLMFLKKIMNKKDKALVDNFNKNNSETVLLDEHKRLLAFGAILFYYRDEEILGFKPKSKLSTYLNGLTQQWGINNELEAKEALNRLLSLKTSSEYEATLLQSTNELKAIQKEIAKGLSTELSKVEEVKSAYAWDLCRAVSLAKWCYWVGFLNETDTWEAIRKAASIASSIGKDWQEYTISYLLGRTIQGFELYEVIVEAEHLFNSKCPYMKQIKDIDVYKKYQFKEG